MQKNKFPTFAILISFFLLSCQEKNENSTANEVEGLAGNKSHIASIDSVQHTEGKSRGQFSLDQGVLDSIIKTVLNSAYGAANFDSSRGCWRHSFQTGGDSIEYCMVAATPDIINGGDGARIYLQTHSDPQAGIYSQVDPGLEGLFFIGLDANQKWTALASSPAIDMGQAGDCGCTDSKVIEVGPNIHGWLSTVGGVWQGVQVTRYSLQVPMGGKIRDVSEIPHVSENSPDESNALEVDRDGKVVAGMYPIKVTQTRAGNVLGARLVSYDERKGVYPWNP